MQNLVNTAYKNSTRIYLNQIKDVFNGLSDKLEEAVKAKNTERKNMILKALAVISEGRIYGVDKIDNIQVSKLIMIYQLLN